MINKEEIHLSWVQQVSKNNRNADKILVEKVIRALLLLEGLVRSGLPFIFKGGTSLMLHFNSSKRLSIDIDIMVAGKLKALEEILEEVVKKQGFIRKELQPRTVHSAIEKEHYKFYYTPVHKTAKEEEYVLLDVLYEDVVYSELVELPVASSFVPSKGNPVMVKVPSLDDLLGDKLTAFAPNTTGIPYYKDQDSMSMEIIKQLYDIGHLFDAVTDLGTVRKTFHRFVITELAYRKADQKTEKQVLEDIFQTSLCMVSRGILGNGNFEELQKGIKKVAGFIFSDKNYHIEKAIIAASKAAYLSVLISTDANRLEKFKTPQDIKDWNISHQNYTRLNKLKKSNPEAFFYWYKIVEILP